MSTAKLYAIVALADRWHGGQWSRLYRLGCMARSRLETIGISDPYSRAVGVHGERCDTKPSDRRPKFRREVVRHYRALLKVAK